MSEPNEIRDVLAELVTNRDEWREAQKAGTACADWWWWDAWERARKVLAEPEQKSDGGEIE